MIKKEIKTTSNARLQFVRSTNENRHFLFLPGGPGLGSESLIPLINILSLPGTIWRLDLPGDGSNTTDNNYAAFSHWQAALIEAVSAFEHVILVAHSSGGMFALSTPEIESQIDGLILLSSAPDASWQKAFDKTLSDFPLPELEILVKLYPPGNELLKKLTIASAPYFLTEKSMLEGIKMLQSMPYNYEAFQWSAEHFDQTYRAKWIPQKIPTLILGGDKDLITPQTLFKESKLFQRDNIKIETIKNAGHFPWLDDPKAVVSAFREYLRALS